MSGSNEFAALLIDAWYHSSYVDTRVYTMLRKKNSLNLQATQEDNKKTACVKKSTAQQQHQRPEGQHSTGMATDRWGCCWAVRPCGISESRSSSEWSLRSATLALKYCSVKNQLITLYRSSNHDAASLLLSTYYHHPVQATELRSTRKQIALLVAPQPVVFVRRATFGRRAF